MSIHVKVNMCESHKAHREWMHFGRVGKKKMNTHNWSSIADDAIYSRPASGARMNMSFKFAWKAGKHENIQFELVCVCVVCRD